MEGTVRKMACKRLPTSSFFQRQVKCTINKGKGRLKSWTLCDGLSEGVMGQGLAVPPPSPAHPWCRSTTEGLLLTRETHVPCEGGSHICAGMRDGTLCDFARPYR